MSFDLLTSNARAYTHIDDGKDKRNYLTFDDNLIISGTDIPPCRIVETGLNLKQFNKMSQYALREYNYPPSSGCKHPFEDILESQCHDNERPKKRKRTS